MRNARNDVYGRTAVGEFLNPINGYRGRLAQRGIKPKNHARENLRVVVALQPSVEAHESSNAFAEHT